MKNDEGGNNNTKVHGTVQGNVLASRRRDGTASAGPWVER